MMPKRGYLVMLLVFVCVIGGCVASNLNEAKTQYLLALRHNDPTYYQAALTAVDEVIARDPNLLQAYVIKGLIYRNLGDFARAKENLSKVGQATFGGELQWVPIVMNLTYGDIFHLQAGKALEDENLEEAKALQETALQFFNDVINISFSNFGESSGGGEYGITMEDLYIKAQQRWASAKIQMAAIVREIENDQAQQQAFIQEAIARLTTIIASFPEVASLRYYLADAYYSQSRTIATEDPAESARLQEQSLSALRVCAEIGLPWDLRGPAANLVYYLTKEKDSDLEKKLRGAFPTE